MNIQLISNIAIAAVTVIFLIVGIVWGLKRGVMRSLFRLVTIVAAAVIAYFISMGLTTRFYPQIQSAIATLATKGGEVFVEVTNASPSAVDFIVNLGCALVAPLLYTLLFCILRPLLWFVYAALCMFLPSKKKHPISGLSRFLGVAVSTVGCVVIVISLLMPMAGYMKLASGVYADVKESGVVSTESMPADLEEQLATAANAKSVGLVDKLGGGFLFSRLSTASGVDIRAELDSILNLIPAVMRLSEINFEAMFDDSENVDLSPIQDDLIPAVDDAEELKCILAELLAYAGGKWLRDETAFGFDIKASLPPEYEGTLDAVLARLEKTTADTVTTDLTDLVNTVQTIADTYTYLYCIGDKSNTMTQEELHGAMSDILKGLTPGSAELVSQAVTSTLVENALVGTNTGVIADLVSDSLTEIATLTDEEKEAEAAAINSLISYTSAVRKDDVKSEEVVDALLESQTVQNVIQEKGTIKEGETEPETKIAVSENQKIAMEAAIAEKELTATPEELATLEALRNMLYVAPPTTPETPPETEPVPDTSETETETPVGEETETP